MKKYDDSKDFQDLKKEKTTHVSQISAVQGADTLIELKSGIKLTSFCCFLVSFNLSVILSSIYFVIQINGALKVFNDIEDNWQNNFILDVAEMTTSSCSESLITYKFPGAASGCFCQDCEEDSDDGDYEFQVQGLLDNAYNDNNGSVDEDYFLDDRLLEGGTEDSYEDFSYEDFGDIMNYKIISKECGNVDDLNEDVYFQNIGEVPSKTIQSLLGDDNTTEINLCVSRSKTHNFLNSYFRQGQMKCEENQILCTSPDDTDKSYWFCGDPNEKCPIRKIVIISSGKVASSGETYEEEIKLSNGYSVLISRLVAGAMPISQFGLFEGSGPCIEATKVWGLSSETLIVNPLLQIKQSKICKRDTRFKKSEIKFPQKQYLKHFGVLHNMRAANYPMFFLPQEQVELALYSRSYISFSITCRDILPDTIELGDTIYQLKKLAITILSFSSSLSIILLIDIGYIFYCFYKIYKDQDVSYPWRFSSNLVQSIIYSCIKYPVALCLCVLDCVFFYKLINTREIGEEIIQRDCTDDISSDQFRVVRSHLSFYGIFFHLIVCLGFWSSDLHLINFWRQYCFMKKTKMTPFDEFFALAFVEDDSEEIGGIKKESSEKYQRSEDSRGEQMVQQDLSLKEQGEVNHEGEHPRIDLQKLQSIGVSKIGDNSPSKWVLQGTTPLYLDEDKLTNQVVKINMRKESTSDRKTYNKSQLFINKDNNNNVSTLKEEKYEEDDEEEEEEEKIQIYVEPDQNRNLPGMDAIPETTEQNNNNNISDYDIPIKELLTSIPTQRASTDCLKIDCPKLKKASVSAPLFVSRQNAISGQELPASYKKAILHSSPNDPMYSESPEKSQRTVMKTLNEIEDYQQQQTQNNYHKKQSMESKFLITPTAESQRVKSMQDFDMQRTSKQLKEQQQIQSEAAVAGESNNGSFNPLVIDRNVASMKKQNTHPPRFKKSWDSNHGDQNQTVSEGGESDIIPSGLLGQRNQLDQRMELINFDTEEDKK